jgi:CHAT domain-containing protein
MHSALYLAPDEYLTALDVLEHLRLRCDLVTISACDSGLNRVRRGDELVGLARAFMEAGAPALIVTLWRVDERSTRLLMDRFYQEARNGAGFAAALQRAQLYLMSLTRQQALDALIHLLAEDLLDPASRSSDDPAYNPPALAREYGRTYLKGVIGEGGQAVTLPDDPDDLIFADPFFWAPFILVGEHGSH